MNRIANTERITLIVSNPEKLQHGSAPQYTFDSAGGTIGCRAANWILTDSQQRIDPIHCEVALVEGAFCLIDRSGRTSINNSEDGIGHNRIVRLNEGDTLHVGPYRITAHLNDSNTAQHHQKTLGTLLNEESPYLLEQAPVENAAPEIYRHEAEPIEGPLQSLTRTRDKRGELDPLMALDEEERRAQEQSIEITSLDPTHFGRSPRQQTQQNLAETRFEAVAGNPHSDIGEEVMHNSPSHASEDWHNAYSNTDEDTRHLAAIPLLQGLNIHVGTLNAESAHYLLYEAGRALRAAINGIANLYENSSSHDHRLSMLTRTLQPIEDNPLRLRQSYEEMVHSLLSSQRSLVHLSAEAAIEESLTQARRHNTAVIEAITESLDALLHAFSPAVLERRFQRYTTGERQEVRDGWNWQMYTHYYDELTSTRQHGFEKLFWEVFEQAYDRAIRAEPK